MSHEAWQRSGQHLEHTVADKHDNDFTMHDKNELEAQLSRIGDAAEQAVPRTTASDILSHPSINTDVTDSSNALHAAEPEARRRRTGLAAAMVALIVAGVVAASLFLAADRPESQIATQPGPTGSGATPDDRGWSDLRHCESTGDYAIDTGNTFYGAYQFARSTWQLMLDEFSLAGSVPVNPANASPLAQDTLANELYLLRGSAPWPICGKFLTGPMNNPMIPQWLPAGQVSIDTIVFLQPYASDSDIAAVRERLSAETNLTPAQIEFVSQQDALAEFQDQFAGTPQMRESVQGTDMPTSFRFALSHHDEPYETKREIERWPDVFAVMQASSHRPWTVDIPRFELEASAIDADHATVADLINDVLVLAPAGWPPIGASEASDSVLPPEGPVALVSARQDWRLQAMRAGDLVTITTPLMPTRGVVAQVQARVRESARSYSIDELGAIDDFDFGTIMLVAIDPDDPARRLVIATNPVIDAG